MPSHSEICTMTLYRFMVETNFKDKKNGNFHLKNQKLIVNLYSEEVETKGQRRRGQD